MNRSEYNRYLKSSQWATTRNDHLAFIHETCEMCGYPKATHVVHLSWDNIGEEEPGDLMGMCYRCFKKTKKHFRKEDRPRQNKRTGYIKKTDFSKCVKAAKRKYIGLPDDVFLSFTSLACEVYKEENGVYPKNPTKSKCRRYLLEVLLHRRKRNRYILDDDYVEKQKKKKKRKKKKKPGTPYLKKSPKVRIRKACDKKGNIRGDAMTQEKLDELTAAYKQRTPEAK